MTTRLTQDPFADLDRDWTAFCRRLARANVLARWAQAEPVFADVGTLNDIIPAPGADRTEACDAAARLWVAGDRDAGRVLLQLLIPGMIRITTRWHSRYPTIADASRDVIARTWLYVGRLQEAGQGAGPANYIIKSVQRDISREPGPTHRRQLNWMAGSTSTKTIPVMEPTPLKTPPVPATSGSGGWSTMPSGPGSSHFTRRKRSC